MSGYCRSCDIPLNESPGRGCQQRAEHLNLMPKESYRGPEPREAGWNWPTTTAFLGLLVFFGFIMWLVMR